MDFNLSAEQKMMQRVAREFAEKELAPGVIDRDEGKTFDMSLVKKLGEAGLIGIQYPTSVGGQGGDYLSYTLIIEELSKVDSSFGIAYSISTTGFGGAIMLFANEAQQQYCMPRLCRGDALGCFALTEPDTGSDAGGAKTRAEKVGDEYIINGVKHFITNGPVADYCFLVASTDPEKGSKGLSAFLVDLKTTPGVRIGHIENKCGIASAQVSELIFEDCHIPADRLIGEEGKGFRYALTTLNAGRLGVAAQGLGLAQGAFEACRSFMQDRIQFGKPIHKHQALNFRMADLEVDIDMARLLLYKAVSRQDAGEDFAIDAAKAKLACTDLAMHVTTECVQMMGGSGYMKEFHVERMFRDAKITQIYEGTNEIQRLIIGGNIFS